MWQEYNWEIFEALARERSDTVPYASIGDDEKLGNFVDYLPRYVYRSFQIDGVTLAFLCFFFLHVFR